MGFDEKSHHQVIIVFHVSTKKIGQQNLKTDSSMLLLFLKWFVKFDVIFSGSHSPHKLRDHISS